MKKMMIVLATAAGYFVLRAVMVALPAIGVTGVEEGRDNFLTLFLNILFFPSKLIEMFGLRNIPAFLLPDLINVIGWVFVALFINFLVDREL
jgi:cytochrome b561